MNVNLTTKTEEWMQLERKTLEQRKLAEQFYDENLMDLIVEDYIERNQSQVMEDVQFLVVSVGTSYEPIALNLKLLKPEKILFLSTEQSERIIEKIVSYCGLKAYQYEKRRVNETDPLDIYREIKNIYLKWGKPDKMYIDFTGGTKSMSAACAMAGAVIDVQLLYVGTNDYLVDFRKPNPGTETLYYITNPLAVFGDLEIEKSLTLFSKYNFAGSKEKLEVLKESIPDPEIRQQLNFVYLLAHAYEAWDALDFEVAHEVMERLNYQLKRDSMHKQFLLMDCYPMLKKQEVLLSSLAGNSDLIQAKKNMEILRKKDTIVSLMFTMYQNAMTREQQEKYDMATLLLYRLLEMIEQRRLSQYNLYVSNMDYSKIKYNERRQLAFHGKSDSEKFEILKNEVFLVKQGIFGRVGSNYLPDQVSLLEGYIILYALRDPIAFTAVNDKYVILKRIRSMVYLRNNSIFAHGLGPVKKADYMKFSAFVKEMFLRYCQIEKIDFETFENIVKWISPIESDNYTSMEP